MLCCIAPCSDRSIRSWHKRLLFQRCPRQVDCCSDQRPGMKVQEARVQCRTASLPGVPPYYQYKLQSLRQPSQTGTIGLCRGFPKTCLVTALILSAMGHCRALIDSLHIKFLDGGRLFTSPATLPGATTVQESKQTHVNVRI